MNAEWKPGVSRALALLVAYTLGLVVLVLLETWRNTLVWINVRNSIEFFSVLWLLLAVPTVVVSHMTHSKYKKDAWKFLVFLVFLGVAIPYGYCNNFFSGEFIVMCGSFGSFSIEEYWTAAVVVVVAMAALIYHDTR